MIVLVCATGIQKTMPLYLRQLQAAGFDCEWGCHDLPIGHHAGSWRGKVFWQRDALARLDPAEQVLLTDGWDIVFQGTREEVEEKFPLSDEIVISGEKNCWPDWALQSQYPMGPTPWMFVNSGGIAGTAGVLLAEMERALTHEDLVEDDQRMWTWLFLTGNRIRIDYECRLFQTMFLNIVGSDLWVRAQDKRLSNGRTGTTPNFLHWNGGDCWPPETLKLLGMEEQ